VASPIPDWSDARQPEGSPCPWRGQSYPGEFPSLGPQIVT
jgi:hypothetical protein